MTLAGFLALVRQTYDQPQETARQVMGLGLSVSQCLTALGLAAILTTIVTLIPAAVAPFPDPVFAALLGRPLFLAAIQFAVFVLGAWLMTRIGRAFGGRGSYVEALAVLAWMQFVLVALQAFQVLIGLAIPILALPVALFSIFSFFFLLSHFTAALHGFSSVGKVLGGVLVTLVLLAFGLAMIVLSFAPVPHV